MLPERFEEKEALLQIIVALREDIFDRVLLVNTPNMIAHTPVPKQ